jgi:hypothetical protein
MEIIFTKIGDDGEVSSKVLTDEETAKALGNFDEFKKMLIENGLNKLSAKSDE